jgi:sulfide:quinone oxidoreductase
MKLTIKNMTADFAVSPQVQPDDINDIVKAGYKTLICNRPDGEGEGQPDHDTIEKLAKAAGLKFAYVPVIPGLMSENDMTSFASAYKTLPKPILAYCRSGARSSTLWMESKYLF